MSDFEKAQRPAQASGLTAGTEVLTARGAVVVEALQLGDLVRLAGGGLAVVEDVHISTFDAEALWQAPELAPVRVAAHALGKGCPAQDMLVSQGCRIGCLQPVPSSGRVQSVACSELIPRPGIAIAREVESVSYVTLILDGAGYVFAEGLAVAAGDVPAPDAHTPEPRRAGAYSVGR